MSKQTFHFPACFILFIKLEMLLTLSDSLSVVRCSNAQYSWCFIPVSTECWNGLYSGVVEYLELQKFKVRNDKTFWTDIFNLSS